MTFEEIVDQAIAMLQRRGRVAYRTLKRQFQLDDEALEDLKTEIIKAQRLAVDEDGDVLVWTGGTTSPGVPAGEPTPAPRSYTPAHLAEKILLSKTALEGERKQVTVLFADLKASMELLADRDPEEARQLLDPVLERMMAAVHRYEGTVNQVMGDGIMALFGAPIAHEDHAVRACYAALAMQEAMRRYSEEVRRTHGITVQMRVGLNSGEVVVRAIGNDLHMDYSAIGQTTHLAARMEQLATSGSILLTAETLQLAEGFIQVKALGPVPVKGLAAPVEVFELVGATAIRRRLQAAVGRGLTRFVGRADGARSPPARPGAGRGRARPGRGGAGRGGRGEVAPGVRAHPFPPPPGVVGARERLGVLWQSDTLFSRHRSAQALRPHRGGRRRAHRAGQGHRAVADVGCSPAGHHPSAPGPAGGSAGGQPLPAARSAAAAPAHAGRAQAGAGARKPGAAAAARL